MTCNATLHLLYMTFTIAYECMLKIIQQNPLYITYNLYAVRQNEKQNM